MQKTDKGKDILSFRMDDQKQRLTITGEKGDGLGFIGWEVENKEDLDKFASKLEENKVRVNLGKNSFEDKRFVEDLIFFNDLFKQFLKIFSSLFFTDLISLIFFNAVSRANIQLFKSVG